MNANEIHIHDKKFKLLFSQQQIDEVIKQLAEKLNKHYEKKRPLLIPVLNGSFIFAADLCRYLNFFHEISFIKVSSYIGTTSTGTLQEKIGLSENITGKDVLIIEDIIDSGNTLSRLIPEMQLYFPSSIKVCTLLLKPNSLKSDVQADFVGKEIPDDFVVGYGLDYNGLGRNLKNIYVEIT